MLSQIVYILAYIKPRAYVQVVASRGSTPAPTPNPIASASFNHGPARIKAANMPLLLHLQQQQNDEAPLCDSTLETCNIPRDSTGDEN